MAHRLRLARYPVNAYSPPAGVECPGQDLHRRLQGLIRRHLSPITAALLAEPQPSTDGRFIEWYTELAGQPVALPALPAEEQEKARTLLQDRLAALRRLARELSGTGSEAALGAALQQALAYPGDETVYVVDGQPVLTFWGYGSPPAEPEIPAPPAPEIPARAPAGGVGPARAPRWPRLFPRVLLPILIIALLSWLAVHFWPWRWPPWGPDYGALIATERAEEARLRERLLALNADLAQTLGHCALRARLDALREEEAALSERLSGMQTRLTGAIAACRDRDALAVEQDGLRQRIAELHARLADQLKVCAEKVARKAADAARLPKPLKGKPPEGKPPAKTADAPSRAVPKDAQAARPEKPDSKKVAGDGGPQAKPQGLPPCPGERPPEEAPDVAIVLDSSGSMRLPERMTRGQQAQYAACVQGSGNPLVALIQHMTCYGLFQGLGGPTRLQAAQQSMQNVVRSLPGDVDIGLAVLEDCPRASDYGFFSGSERNRLLGQVNRLVPKQGTPLANGVALGGKMIDGVRSPGIMVVVSDGEDSCRQDPCAVARQLKSGKPRLKINVVDITGEGYANCLAEITGGRVLSSASGMPMDQMIREAASEAEKPAHCK